MERKGFDNLYTDSRSGITAEDFPGFRMRVEANASSIRKILENFRKNEPWDTATLEELVEEPDIIKRKKIVGGIIKLWESQGVLEQPKPAIFIFKSKNKVKPSVKEEPGEVINEELPFATETSLITKFLSSEGIKETGATIRDIAEAVSISERDLLTILRFLVKKNIISPKKGKGLAKYSNIT